MVKRVAIIPSAGQGRRMGTATRKQFLYLLDKPVLVHTLQLFSQHPLIDEIVLVTNKEDVDLCNEMVVNYHIKKVNKIIVGGKERQDSVKAGLDVINEDVNIVVVHDGARPLVSSDTITTAIKTAEEYGSGVVAVPVKDTIKIINNNLVIDTPPRQQLWAVQTPQVFQREIIIEAYDQAYINGWQGTDDSSLVEKIGNRVKIVPGNYTNLKITTPEDLVIAEALIKSGLVNN